jgi:Lysine methyltransferase
MGSTEIIHKKTIWIMSGPSSNNSSSFTFNFHISDANEHGVQDVCNETANDDDADQEDSQSIEHPPRLPFKWIDDDYVKAIMLERSKQALVYSDIPLAYHNPSDEIESTPNEVDGSPIYSATLERHSDLLDEMEPSCPQPHTRIRCVDLSLSSFRKKCSTDELTEYTDIVPGKYEGGRQVWECSLDLLHYLVQNHITLQQLYGMHNLSVLSSKGNIPLAEIRSEFSTKKFVLELGCGHGLPGIYLLRQALQSDDLSSPDFTVVFTDYNESVLLDATISNAVLNCFSVIPEDERPGVTSMDVLSEHVVLGGGDWLDMSHQIRDNISGYETLLSKLPPDGYFDMILAAETIYTTATAHETAMLLKRHLRPDTGIAYIASKRYYFGVGGGVDAFRDYCVNVVEDALPLAGGECQLVLNTVKVIDNGTGNIREILSVQSRSCTT